MGNGQVILFDNRKQEKWESNQNHYFKKDFTNEILKMQQDAVMEATKSVIKDLAINSQKFNNLVKRSSTVLYKLSSAMPFDMFPNTITIDQEKIVVNFREILSPQDTRIIYIKNISALYVDTGPFFATLSIYDQTHTDDKEIVKISFLKKDEAFKAKRIIQGLLVVSFEHVDITRIQDIDLLPKLESLGMVS